MSAIFLLFRNYILGCTLILFAILGLPDSSLAQTKPDSVYISGRILNLTGRLFREAPEVTFSRNNILAPQTEMVRNAPIQADGSFKVALPLIFEKEEVYLDYGGKVFTTFLASPGTVEVVFNADSIFKSERLFYFSGVNADANNRYTMFLAEENRILKNNKRHGEDFQKNFWAAPTPSAARRLIEERVRLRRSALEKTSQNMVPSRELTDWVAAFTQDEQSAYLLGYTLMLNDDAETATLDEMEGIVRVPLTLQRIEWMTAIKNYVNREIDRANVNGKQKTLKVNKMAELVARYVSPLSEDERRMLNRMANSEGGSREEINKLSAIYERGPGILRLITNYETRKQAFTGDFRPVTEEFINAMFFTDNIDLFLPEEKNQMFEHINKDIKDPVIKRSLAEIYQFAIRGVSDFQRVLEKQLSGPIPTEVMKDVWMAETGENGAAWFENVKSQLPGRPLYVTLWQLGDAISMEEMRYANGLRDNSPEEVRFIYIHIAETDTKRQRDLWKQFIVGNNLSGIHLYMSMTQAFQLAGAVNAYDIPSYLMFRGNGRQQRNTPPPSKGLETVRFIEKAVAR
jgi:hypothetical protein